MSKAYQRSDLDYFQRSIVKSNKVHTNEMMKILRGKSLHYINSAPYSFTTEATILLVFIMHKREQKATKTLKEFLSPNFRLLEDF